jgi:hypothetical protein
MNFNKLIDSLLEKNIPIAFLFIFGITCCSSISCKNIERDREHVKRLKYFSQKFLDENKNTVRIMYPKYPKWNKKGHYSGYYIDIEGLITKEQRSLISSNELTNFNELWIMKTDERGYLIFDKLKK